MRRLLLALAFALAAAPTAAAEPIVVKRGKTVLPLSGLRVDLPRDPRPGFTWNLSGSYELTNDGTTYNGRDVIDEKVGGDLVAGTWVTAGYFDAGGCKATLAETPLSDAWTDARKLYGLDWELRGGRFDLGQLGVVPAVTLCSHADGKKDLVLYRFFLGTEPGFGRDQVLAALPKLTLLQRVADAWKAGRTAPAEPRRRPEVRSRSKDEPKRAKLPVSGLDVAVPDDGFVWIVHKPDPSDTTDWFERMAPAMPEVRLELIRTPRTDCKTLFASITTPRDPAAKSRNVPAGWVALPSLDVDGDAERVVCRQGPNATLIVGLFDTPERGPTAGDFGPLAPLLAELARASDAAPAP